MICTKYQPHVLYSHTPGDPVFCLGYSANVDKLSDFLAFYGIACEPISHPLPIMRAEALIKKVAEKLGLVVSSSDEYEPILQRLMEKKPDHNETSKNPTISIKTLRSLFSYFRIMSDSPRVKTTEQIRAAASAVSAGLGVAPGSVHSNQKPVGTEVSLDDCRRFAEDASKIAADLAGRSLTKSEIGRWIKREELYAYNEAEFVLDIASNLGLCKRIPSISLDKAGDPRCNRCGATRRLINTFCPGCRSADCWLCLECNQMGEVRSCYEFFLIPHSASSSSVNSRFQEPKNGGTYINLDFELTKPQSDASQAIREFVKGDHSQECLVWAVCGAGKTEVAYSAIEEALIRKQKILFAIPRRDVVIELEPRLRSAFPDVRISVLYGGVEKKLDDADIVLSTTHQVIRFYDRFDLVVVDEADAFPFYGNASLFFCLKRAMKRAASKLVYMTATPDKAMRTKVQAGKMALVTIPARHHGKPLPEPELTVGKLLNPNAQRHDSMGRLSLPREVSAFIDESILGGGSPLFVFAPTIGLVQRYARILSDAYPTKRTEYCHSKDPRRLAKRQAFKDGEIDLFITTSIMERGITVDKCNVIVLNADFEQIFDESGLIQMAGRVGRTTANPGGRVLFVGNQINSGMEGALDRIRHMNSEAEIKGYLRVAD